MSEENKRITKWLEDLSDFGLSYTLQQKDLDGIKTILNLIAEQQDEINVVTAQRDSIKNQFEQAKEVVEKQKNEITDMKEIYIRTAKHQEKTGHTELAEYMLAQIEAVPTFTTWEEYTTWISKEKIRNKIKEIIEYAKNNKRSDYLKKAQDYAIDILNDLLEESE